MLPRMAQFKIGSTSCMYFGDRSLNRGRAFAPCNDVRSQHQNAKAARNKK